MSYRSKTLTKHCFRPKGDDRLWNGLICCHLVLVLLLLFCSLPLLLLLGGRLTGTIVVALVTF